MYRCGLGLWSLVAAAACATSSVEPGASTDPPTRPVVVSSAPVAPPPGVPAAMGGDDEELVLDHRGAFGPVLVDQFAIDLDQRSSRCLLLPVRPARDPAANQRTAAIDAATGQRLQALAQALLAAPPTDVKRRFVIHDFGTLTLTVRDQGRARTLTVDGTRSVDPYPKELLALLQQLRSTCEGTPAADSQPATAPAATGN